MTLRLRFFASLRERAGAAEKTLQVEGPMTVGALWERLCGERSALAAAGGKIAFAVNQEYVDRNYPLQDNDEVAFIPPVSGGTPRVTNV